MKNKEIYFYDKFILKDNIRNAEEKDKFRFFNYSMSTLIFSFFLGSFTHFFGYNLTQGFGQGMFVWYIFFLFFLLYFSIRFILLEKKYKVFKKWWMPTIFVIGCYLLTIAMCISAYFTTKLIPTGDMTFIIKQNPIYYFFVFTPLFIGYYFFCYYAFLKFFAKFSKINIKRHGNP